MSVLLMGSNLSGVAANAAKIAGPSKILTMESAALENNVAENVAKALSGVATKYTHVLTPSSNIGKNFMPRLGAMLNSSPLSEVQEVQPLFVCLFVFSTNNVV
jgi:electron transfer flavoprotein alpha subunit